MLTISTNLVRTSPSAISRRGTSIMQYFSVLSLLSSIKTKKNLVCVMAYSRPMAAVLYSHRKTFGQLLNMGIQYAYCRMVASLKWNILQ